MRKQTSAEIAESYRKRKEYKSLVFQTSGAIELSKSDIENFTSPMVYVFSVGALALYVGMSKNGISRPFEPTHHAKKVRQEADSLDLYLCDSKEEAAVLQLALIHRLNPKYNRR
jgi:excinuclease UvrABC nuclease subunit